MKTRLKMALLFAIISITAVLPCTLATLSWLNELLGLTPNPGYGYGSNYGSNYGYDSYNSYRSPWSQKWSLFGGNKGGYGLGWKSSNFAQGSGNTGGYGTSGGWNGGQRYNYGSSPWSPSAGIGYLSGGTLGRPYPGGHSYF